MIPDWLHVKKVQRQKKENYVEDIEKVFDITSVEARSIGKVSKVFSPRRGATLTMQEPEVFDNFGRFVP